MSDPWGGLNGNGTWGGLSQSVGNIGWNNATTNANASPPQQPSPWGGMGGGMGGGFGRMGRMGGLMGMIGGMMNRMRPPNGSAYANRWGGINPGKLTPWEVAASGVGGSYPGGVGNNGSYGPSLTPYDTPVNDPNFVPGAGNYRTQADSTPMGLLYNMTNDDLLRYPNPGLDFRNGQALAQQVGQYATTPLSQIPANDMTALMDKLHSIASGFGKAIPVLPYGADPNVTKMPQMDTGGNASSAIDAAMMGWR